MATSLLISPLSVGNDKLQSSFVQSTGAFIRGPMRKDGGARFVRVYVKESLDYIPKQFREGNLKDGCKFVLILICFCTEKVDPSTSEAEEDGIEDEHQLEDSEIVAADYMLKVGVSNFRIAWESLGPDFERVDEYGLGPRENLSEAVNVVINLLGEVAIVRKQHHYLFLVLLKRNFDVALSDNMLLTYAFWITDFYVHWATHCDIIGNQWQKNHKYVWKMATRNCEKFVRNPWEIKPTDYLRCIRRVRYVDAFMTELVISKGE
ncbi:coatomer subunit gamma-2 [Artemisia annua]|uniref:Coatomer subunit gamma-2 n=1 Tax=Artemisia annua TaxID=35608 RepID=A0A2U1QJG0_ARTAN|nr:coatomer subunit gamma-2 [Artemisia annua]